MPQIPSFWHMTRYQMDQPNLTIEITSLFFRSDLLPTTHIVAYLKSNPLSYINFSHLGRF